MCEPGELSCFLVSPFDSKRPHPAGIRGLAVPRTAATSGHSWAAVAHLWRTRARVGGMVESDVARRDTQNALVGKAG